MAVFEYKGLDASGKAVAGIVDADTAKVARARLRKQGLFPTEIHAQAGKGTRQGESILDMQIDVASYFQFISARDVSIMTTQLSTLVGAHVPMAEALSALVDQTEKAKFKVVLSKVKEKVVEGGSLGDAMSDHPKVFDDLYVQMVRAGEKSGALDQVLARLATYADGQVKLQSQVLSAVAYPILLGIMGIGILSMLFLFVIPRIRNLFDSMPGGAEALPLLTKVVFFFGDVLVGWWWAFPMLVGLVVVGFRRWVRTETGRRRWDTWRLKFPVFGTMSRLVAVSRFCRTLSTLLISGVPIISALRIVQDVVGNVVLADAVGDAAHSIQEGQSIAVPLRNSGEFPPMVTHMVGIGERTGELERMLRVVADAYEDQVDATITAMTSLLAPVMIMIMGGAVFVVALGLLMPMMNISQMIK
ncbi:MAG: type II secretion system inner membrane protein GspF [Myxococcales bacterium]|nr:type II secretion system inner membrane protein GspF [Myxococcales bacterium]